MEVQGSLAPNPDWRRSFQKVAPPPSLEGGTKAESWTLEAFIHSCVHSLLRHSRSTRYVQHTVVGMGDPKKVGALVKVTFQWRKQATSKRTNIPWIVSDCCEGVRSGEGGGRQRARRGVPYTGGQDSFSKGRKGIRGSRDLRGNGESKGLMKSGTV